MLASSPTISRVSPPPVGDLPLASRTVDGSGTGAPLETKRRNVGGVKRKTMIHHAPVIKVENGRAFQAVELHEVRVMAVAEGYAMVRRAGAMPYIAKVKDLHEPTPKREA